MASGVPQGAILSPSLFVFIYDIPNVGNNSDIHLYADVILYAAGPSPDVSTSGVF